MSEDQPTHAFYAPSSLKYRALCAGWRKDDGGDKTAADEGTMLHKAVETGVIPDTCTEEQKQVIQQCLDFLKPLESKAARVFKELKLKILDGLTFGTSDRVVEYLIRKNTHVSDCVDFKFGRGAIDDPQVNPQGFCYVLGVFSTLNVDAVRMIFLIPRRDEVLTHTFQRKDVPKIELAVRTIIGRCEEYDKTHDESLLTPVEEACLYCGNIRCPKRFSYAVEIAKKYAPLEIVDDVHSSEITDPAVMSKALTIARIMEKWAASVKQHAMQMYLNGRELPGYEMRERSANREINNPILALPVLKSYLEPEEIVACSKLSLSKLEKLVSDKAQKGEKKKAIADFNRLLLEAECVTSGEPTRFLQKIKE